MAEYKPLEVLSYPRVGSKITQDTEYWKRLSFPVAVKEYGAIDCIDFAAQEPHYFAVTCSSKVQIYNPLENTVWSNLGRFKKTAYGGVFRQDGRMLVAGSEDGFLRLFDVQSNRHSNKPLRIFKGHKAATHRCNFFKDGINVVSFSDDKSVGVWDIPTETRLLTYAEHKDYIRAGTTCKSTKDVILSGSYDHMVKMYDTRIDKCVMTFDHGAPVESLLMFPSGGLFLSSGGTQVKIWDSVAGRLLSALSNHHKTVTSLCFASDGRRVMSCSLDRHVKIYDTSTYEVVHTLDYPSPILSVASAPGDKVVIVGMVDGLISIRHQKLEKVTEEEKRKNEMKRKHYQHIFRGTDFKPCDGDILIPTLKRKKSELHDQYLRSFQSSLALDVVLKYDIQCKKPEVTVSVIQELIRRGALKAAIAGREGESLASLLKFVQRYVSDKRFARVLYDVGVMIIEVYSSKLSDPTINKMMHALLQSFKEEVKCTHDDFGIQEKTRNILAVSYLNSQVDNTQERENDREAHLNARLEALLKA